MSRFGVSDGAAFHRKVVDAGNEAFGAWTRAGSWSSAPENLTDGYIPPAIAATLAPPRVWKKLREVGLTEAPSGGRPGEQIHGYLEHNPSAERVRAERDAWRDRQRKSRESRPMSRRDTPVTPPVTLAVTPGVHIHVHDPDPSDPDHTHSAGAHEHTREAPPAPSSGREAPPLRELGPAVGAVVGELGTLAEQLRGEGSGLGEAVCEKLAAGQMPTPRQLATLRKIRDERAVDASAGAAAPRRGRAPPRGPDVQRAPPGDCWSDPKFLTSKDRAPQVKGPLGYGESDDEHRTEA